MATVPPLLAAGHLPSGSELQAYRTAIQELQTLAAWAPARGQDSTAGTTTSTTYTSTLTGVSTPLSVSFVAPRTSVAVTFGAVSLNTGAAGPYNQYMSIGATGPSYSVSPSDAYAAVGQWVNGTNVGGMSSHTAVLTGLTVGATYTVTPRFRVTGSTGSFGARYCCVHL